MSVLSNGHWRGIPIPFLVIGGVFFLALLLWTPASRAARRLVSDHRHRWTAKEHRAVIRFYLASRDLDPHRHRQTIQRDSRPSQLSFLLLAPQDSKQRHQFMYPLKVAIAHQDIPGTSSSAFASRSTDFSRSAMVCEG